MRGNMENKWSVGLGGNMPIGFGLSLAANEKSMEATSGLFSVLFKITASLNISEENCNHIIRTLRGFLEGFSLLVNNQAFGNPISIEESFELSVNVLIEGIKTLEE